MPTQPTHPSFHLSPWSLLRIFGSIGLQSFGGGASTLLLIRREFVEKRDTLTKEEFARFWNLCVMTPGINLIAVTILIGRKLGGIWGIVLSLAGLLLPSAILTCALTAGFTIIQSLPVIQAILRGVVPATAGIMLVVGLKFAQPLIEQGWNEGALALSISLLFISVVAFALIVLALPVALVLVCAALAGIAVFTFMSRPARPAPAGESEPHD